MALSTHKRPSEAAASGDAEQRRVRPALCAASNARSSPAAAAGSSGGMPVAGAAHPATYGAAARHQSEGHPDCNSASESESDVSDSDEDIRNAASEFNSDSTERTTVSDYKQGRAESRPPTAWERHYRNEGEKGELEEIEFVYGRKFARRVAALTARTPQPTAEGALYMAYEKTLLERGVAPAGSSNPRDRRHRLMLDADAAASRARAAALRARAAFLRAFFPSSLPPAAAAAASGAAAHDESAGSATQQESTWAFYKRRKQQYEQEMQSLQQQTEQLKPQMRQKLIAAEAKHATLTAKLGVLQRQQAEMEGDVRFAREQLLHNSC